MTNLNFHVQPSSALQGTLRVPGDKSISHRALMFGAVAQGVTTIHGFLRSADCLATLQAFRDLGVVIEEVAEETLRVHGVGLHGLRAPQQALDVGNSGTAMRLMSGLLAGQAFDSVLTGDASLQHRPMRRVTAPLTQMGASIASTADGCAPLQIRGGQTLHGIDYQLPVASAQVKSALLLAGLYAPGVTRITEPATTRDHTERLLQGFGYALTRESAHTVALTGGGSLHGIELEIPADLSSATFFMVGASIAPGSDLLLTHVGINPTRSGVIDILRLMGANLELLNPRTVGGEEVADIRVRSAPLHGIAIPEALVPLAIDEFPAIFIAAACATGVTILTGAQELRVKESDRIQVMADGLNALGIPAGATTDGIVIRGIRGGVIPQAGIVHSHGDHRIAMSFAMLGLRSQQPLVITDCANVNTSFPKFAAMAHSAGLNITERET